MEWEAENPHEAQPTVENFQEQQLRFAKLSAFDEGKKEQAKRLVEQYDGFVKLAEQLMNFALEGDYTNGVEFYGQDEGRVRAAEALKQIEDELHQYTESWQELCHQVERIGKCSKRR